MAEGPNISHIASLMGDPARANMLCALMDGRALTASELAGVGGITRQTASSHLAQLEAAGFVLREAQGRHRYFRLADGDIASLLETMMSVAQKTGVKPVRVGPRDTALREARVCYDHLAGEVAVALFAKFASQDIIRPSTATEKAWQVTDKGAAILQASGIEIEKLTKARRPACRGCLDWSSRKYHLAGGLGANILAHAQARGWLRRAPDSRVVHFFPGGREALLALAGQP